MRLVSDVFQSDMYRQGRLDEVNVCNPDEGSRTVRDEAEEEFRTFVTQTYEELYMIESRSMSGKPSICLFCRFDIGVLISNDDRVHYFVNEVEHTQTTSLWSNRQHARSPKAPAGILGDTFAQALYQWLLSMNSPYVVA
jgi:hypothetical protein